MHLDGDIRSKIVRVSTHAAVFSLVINLLTLTVPLYLMQIYDRVLSSYSIETLVYLSIIAVIALVFLGLAEMIRSMYFQRLAASVDHQFGPAALQTALRAGAAGLFEPQPLRDLATVRSFITARGLSNLFDLPFSPLFICILYFVHPLLFWLTLAGIAVLVGLAILNQLAVRGSTAFASERMAAANTAAMAFAAAAETIRAMGMKRGIVEAWGKNFAEATQSNDRACFVGGAFSAASRAVRMVLQLAILGVGAWLVLDEQITAGTIFASSIIAGRALQPVDLLTGGWRGTVEGVRAWSRLTGMMSRSPRDEPQKLTLPALRGGIVARNLTYAAPGATSSSEAIIKRVSFAIEPGEAIAIVGPNRAGKSMLSKLIVGAISPTAGEIRIDGTEIANWDESQLGSGIGYLAQDVQLITGTVAENISRFDPDADHQTIVDAAMRAHAHELITALPEGYQTRISPIAARLSGGEKQRIGLARAFYGSPRIIVLDEPNANLDGEGEAALAKAIAEARKTGCTVIVVTHRISLAESCDRVLALRNGMVEAFGPSAQVLQQLRSGRRGVVPLNRELAAAPASGPAAGTKLRDTGGF